MTLQSLQTKIRGEFDEKDFVRTQLSVDTGKPIALLVDIQEIKSFLDSAIAEAWNGGVEEVEKKIDSLAKEKAAILGGEGFTGVPILIDVAEVMSVLASLKGETINP